MQFNQFCLAQVLISLFPLFLSTAQAKAEVTSIPDSLTITTSRQSIETRNLLIQTTKPLKNLKIIPLDLNRSDATGVIPANAIQPQLQLGTQLAANDSLSIPTKIDLHQLSVSGEFTGVLLVKFEGGQHRVPMLVKVKDSFTFPLVFLITGVILGMAMSAYLQDGRAHDEIVVQMSRLRSHLQADQELAQSFQNKADGWLIDVETALEKRNWELAQKSLESAQALWDKWRKGREDWIVQLTYQKKLLEDIKNGESFDPNALYLQTLIVNLHDAAREVADYESPQTVRKTLVRIVEQMNRYLAGRAQLDRLNEQRNQLPILQAEVWRQKSQNLENRLNNLTPDNPDELSAWEREIETALVDVMKERQQSQQEATRSGSLERTSIPISTTAIAPAPSARDLPKIDGVKQAKRRLQLFGGLAYLIALFLLAGTGFQKLYVANPIFGANPFGDYFSLLAWGFGSEATRQSIAKVVRGWGMPDKSEKSEKA